MSSWNAQLYEDRHAFVWKHAAGLVDLLNPQPSERILDLGCGTGQLTAQIAERGAKVVGIDASPQMIERAQAAYPESSFQILDARGLPFAGEFDAVFSNAALHWILEPQAVVDGVARALKPGGRFVAEFGGRGNVGIIVTALEKALRTLHLPAVSSPWYFPGIPEYAGILEACGLEVQMAQLFDRPTALEGDQGLRNWVAMFGPAFLESVPVERRKDFLHRVESDLRPKLYREGIWFADYRRLRVAAFRKDSSGKR